MKVELFNLLTRRTVLKGGAAAAALGVAGVSALPKPARADLRADLLQIPGVNKGSPTDADWQKVGELCLGATKANVKEGEFKGVELTFMGLNNQNLHNLLFRGFLKPWEAYTGAKINWIDLAQADYNPRLQQAIATGTVDFDIVEMGAPFEGDVCGKGLASEMPDWVKKQIEMDDYVGYLKAPVGTWDGKTYRISIDGDCHNFNYRTDYFSDADLAAGLEGRRPQGRMGRAEDLAAGAGGHQVPQGQAGRRPGCLRLSRPDQGLGRLRLLLPRQPRHRLCQASGRQGLAVRCRHDEAAHQQSGLGPRHPGRDRRAAVGAGRPAQRRSRHHRLPAVPRRHRLDALLVGRRRLERQDQRQLGHRRCLRLLDPAGLGRRLQLEDRQVGQAGERPELRAQHGLYRLGRLRDGARRQRLRRSRRRPGARRRISAARTSRCGWRPIRRASSPTATATSTFRNGSAAGYDEAFITSYLESEANSYNHPNAAIEPRIPGIFQYYSVAEDELAKICAGGSDCADRARTTSPRPGRRSPTRSAATSRSRSTRPRSASEAADL